MSEEILKDIKMLQKLMEAGPLDVVRNAMFDDLYQKAEKLFDRPSPPRTELRTRAFALYKPPFRYHAGYIFDADHHMVSDSEEECFISRIRGWGRLHGKGAMALDPKDAANLQDEVGEMLAEALTAYWESKS